MKLHPHTPPLLPLTPFDLFALAHGQTFEMKAAGWVF